MDRRMAEGNPTFLQHSASQPCGSQGLLAHDITSPSLFSSLHVYDLGLTPSPGSQQREQLDESNQVSSLAEENHAISDRLDSAVLDHLRDESTPCILDDSHDVQGGKQPFDMYTDQEMQALSGLFETPWVPGNLADTEEALFPDHQSNLQGDSNLLFDFDFDLRDLAARFENRKRGSDEAFSEFDLAGPPEKRRLIELSPEQSTTPPDETPSLSSPNSSHLHDQSESFLNTPADRERLQTPDSLFDSEDVLFDESMILAPENSRSLDVSKDVVSPVEPANLAPGNDVSNMGSGDHATSKSGAVDIVHELQSQETPDIQPSVSDITKQRFSLRTPDLVANATRETMQRHVKQPEYLSPYPAHGGPLRYFPSAPALHNHYKVVADDAVLYRMENYRYKIKQLTYERNKYKTAWTQSATIDPQTGKSTEQLLVQENAQLRRVSSQHQRKAEELKREVDHWQRQYSNVATVYNNLLYQVQFQRMAPAFAAPTPMGHVPQYVAGSMVPGPPSAPIRQPPTGQAPQYFPGSMAPGPQSAPIQQPPMNHAPQYLPGSVAPGPPSAPIRQPPVAPLQNNARSIQAPTAAHNSNPVTIDLTSEPDEQSLNMQQHSPSAPAPAPDGMRKLQEYRNKTYSWLENGNRAQNGLQSQHGQRAGWSGGCSPSISSSSGQPSRNTSDDVEAVVEAVEEAVLDEDTDDEIIRLLDEELARD